MPRALVLFGDGGPDATWPTSQSITACMEAGSLGLGGRNNFSSGRDKSWGSPIIPTPHLQWPNACPSRPAQETTPHGIEAQGDWVGQ